LETFFFLNLAGSAEERVGFVVGERLLVSETSGCDGCEGSDGGCCFEAVWDQGNQGAISAPIFVLISR